MEVYLPKKDARPCRRKDKDNPYPDIMTVEEMSKALGVSSKTGYKLIKEGVIKSRKVGRAYRIAKVHLLSYLKVNM